MTLSNGYPGRTPVADQAMKSLALPLGFANPLWLAFGAAASAGAAWWLMARWATPFHLEAAAAAPTGLPASAPDLEPLPLAAVEAPVEAVVEAFAAPEPETALEVEALIPDDFTRMVGVGPRTAAALAARGVTRFAELAAWTADELAAFDAEMSLKGRSLRSAWLDQAKRLAAEV
jgi:predicted flap endonuclease-1-like 5' DNA nuclease